MENTDDPNKPVDEFADEEPSQGVLPANDELEAALREATESVEHRQTQGVAGGDAPQSADKITIEALSLELRELTEKHTAVLAELEENRDKHLRLQAEFENFRRRGLKERQESFKFGHQNLVKDLLPTVDNLERALAHTEEGAEQDLEGLRKGVNLVLKELLGILARHGVAVIDAEGQIFDPAVHEAMAQVSDPSVPPNSVSQVMQRGYQLHDRMLRPARVVVSKSPELGAPDGGK